MFRMLLWMFVTDETVNHFVMSNTTLLTVKESVTDVNKICNDMYDNTRNISSVNF